jgi:hypothetical protein
VARVRKIILRLTGQQTYEVAAGGFRIDRAG